MSTRISRLVVAACLLTGSVYAANDPFVGKWKLDSSKSRFPDEMKVAAAGTNKYVFDFGAGQTHVIAL